MIYALIVTVAAICFVCGGAIVFIYMKAADRNRVTSRRISLQADEFDARCGGRRPASRLPALSDPR